MKASILVPILILMAFLLLVDLYTYRGVSNALASLPMRWLRLVQWLFWSIPVLVLIGLFVATSVVDARQMANFPKVMYLVAFIVLFYFPKLVFIAFELIDDGIKLVAWLFQRLRGPEASGTLGLSRSKFLLQLGMMVSVIPFAGVIHGVVFGRFNFRVVKQRLVFKNLPKAFNGFTILQISDAHLGSFIGLEDKIAAAVELINKQNADIVVFTGDIVNNLAEELDTFVDVFAKIKGKEGKYAVLGNHDYGTHYPWKSKEAKRENLEKLIEKHKQMGFRLLMNEGEVFERAGEKIALLGVENWGTPPFPQYGRLDLAEKQAEGIGFKVLLSHDPTHWEEVVRKESRVDLTLSGHTHGMQFGIKLGGWEWSPVSIRYPRWGGLYTEGKQHLYVNRGFGVIGFPGRIGMDPELTLFELQQG